MNKKNQIDTIRKRNAELAEQLDDLRFKLEYNSQYNGYALTLKSGDNYVFIGGKFDGANTSLKEDSQEYDLVFAGSYAEFVFGYIDGEIKATFTPYSDYVDCESQGVKKFYLD